MASTTKSYRDTAALKNHENCGFDERCARAAWRSPLLRMRTCDRDCQRLSTLLIASRLGKLSDSSVLAQRETKTARPSWGLANWAGDGWRRADWVSVPPLGDCPLVGTASCLTMRAS